MNPLDALIACAGHWNGTSRLQDPHVNLLEEATSTAIVTPILNSRFVRLDYTWAYRQTPQEGSLLIGFDASTSEATTHWIDSWHMSDKAMAFRGTIDNNGELTVLGSYAAPPGPDWGWKIIITPSAKSLRMVMYNITPDGQEELAVEAEYAPA